MSQPSHKYYQNYAHGQQSQDSPTSNSNENQNKAMKKSSQQYRIQVPPERIAMRQNYEHQQSPTSESSDSYSRERNSNNYQQQSPGLQYFVENPRGQQQRNLSRTYQPANSNYHQRRQQPPFYQHSQRQSLNQNGPSSVEQISESDPQEGEFSTGGYEEYRRRNEEFERQQSGHDSEYQRLKLQLENKKLTENYNALVDEYNQIAEENEEMKLTLESVERKNAELIDNIKELEASVIRMQEAQIKEEVEVQRDSQIEEFTQEVERLKRELSEIKRKEGSKTSQQSTLQKLEVQQKQFDQQRLERILEKEKYEKLLTEKDEIIRKIKEDQKVNSGLEAALLNEKQNVQKLSLQNSGLKREVEYLKQETERLREQLLQKYNLQKQSLKSGQSSQASEKEAVQQLQQANRSLERYKNKNSELKTKIYQKESEIQAINEQKDTEIRKIKSQLLETKRILGDKEFSLSEKQQQINHLREENKRKIDEKEHYIQNLEVSLSQLRDKIGVIYQEATKKDEEIARLTLEKERSAKDTDKGVDSARLPEENQKKLNENAILHEQVAKLNGKLKQTSDSCIKFQILAMELQKNNHNYKEENSRLRNQLEQMQNSNGSQFSPQFVHPQYRSLSSPIEMPSNNNSNSLLSKEGEKQLHDQIQKLEKKLSDKTEKLERLESNLRAEYRERIEGLQRELHLASVRHVQSETEILTDNKKGSKDENCIEELIIDGLGSDEEGIDKQIDLQKISPQKSLVQNGQQTDSRAQQKVSEQSNTDERGSESVASSSNLKEKQLKDQIEVMKIQNQSLNAHMEKLGREITHLKQQQLQAGQAKIGQQLPQKQSRSYRIQTEQKLKAQEKEISSWRNFKHKTEKTQSVLQKQKADLRQEVDRLESVSELLKIDIAQSKEKISDLKKTITQKDEEMSKLQQKAAEWENRYNEVKEDNHNLEVINEEINERYRKGVVSFKSEIEEMNQQILSEKSKIQDKKKELKRVEGEYLNKIAFLEDQNMVMDSRLKKQQLQIATLENLVSEIEEQHLEKVIITRTQLLNYKQTEKRLEDLEEKVHAILKDKEKIVGEKKSLQGYFEEEIATLKEKFSVERQRLIKRASQAESLKNQNNSSLQSLRQKLGLADEELLKVQAAYQKLGRQNYNIKLQLSDALSEVNNHLVKAKVVGKKHQQLVKEHEELKSAYEIMVVQKSRYKQDMSQSGGKKIELQMAYKQIEKLNEVLMEKTRQINYYLSSQSLSIGNLFMGGVPQESDGKKGTTKSDDFCNVFENGQSNDLYSQSLKPKETQVYMRKTTGKYVQSDNKQKMSDQKYEQSANKIFRNRETTQDRNSGKSNSDLIGGFKPEYISFTTQYHQI